MTGRRDSDRRRNSQESYSDSWWRGSLLNDMTDETTSKMKTLEQSVHSGLALSVSYLKFNVTDLHCACSANVLCV